MNNKIAQMVTDQMLAIMEQGIIPWNKPWHGCGGAVSHSTGRSYSLINQFMLGGEGEWITYNQAKAEGGQVKKGAKGKPVVFWKQIAKENAETGEVETFPVLRYYTVFRIEDCEGITRKYDPAVSAAGSNLQPDALAEAVVRDYITREGVTLRCEDLSSDAFYSPHADSITVPALRQYDAVEEYYSTLFHEITHSTGHAKRLNRLNRTAAFGNEDYSREELVAEMGAAICCCTCGLDTEKSRKNSAAYLQGWMRALKDDVQLIIAAASRAEKAVELIMGNTLETAAGVPEAASEEASPAEAPAAPASAKEKKRAAAEMQKSVNAVLRSHKRMHQFWSPVSQLHNGCYTVTDGFRALSVPADATEKPLQNHVDEYTSAQVDFTREIIINCAHNVETLAASVVNVLTDNSELIKELREDIRRAKEYAKATGEKYNRPRKTLFSVDGLHYVTVDSEYLVDILRACKYQVIYITEYKCKPMLYFRDADRKEGQPYFEAVLLPIAGE